MTFLFASCQPVDTPDKDDGGIPEGNYLWSTKTDFSIYFAKGFSEEKVINMRSYVESIIGRRVKSYLTSEDESIDKDHVLIIGKNGNEVSKKAYQELDSLTSGKVRKTGYVIYGLDGSVALAYTDDYVFDNMEAKFYELFKSDVANFTNGVIHYEVEDFSAMLQKERSEQREFYFEQLSFHLPAETVDGLRDIYDTFYGEEIYEWAANLYDYEIGGFYYSNSARDHGDYLPDIESTVQILRFFQNSGLFSEYGGRYRTALPSEIKSQLIRFAQGLQSPDDGYFYHPQWGGDGWIARRSRDLDWSTDLLNNLGARPLYDAPNGTKGIYGAPGQSTTQSSAAIVSPLKSSTAVSVSKVIAASTLPDHLKSEEAFLNYLNGLDWRGNSYYVGNEVGSQQSQIKAAGLAEVFIAYVNAIQREDNGLWERQVDYSSVNGLMKIAAAVQSLGGTLKYIDQAMTSTMQMALTVEGIEHVCSTYNPWIIMGILINMEIAVGNTENATRLRKMVIDNSAELIKITFKKMEPFKKSDGGFSYLPHSSAPYSQGAPAAVPETSESDINATTIMSTGILNAIYSTFGVDFVPLYYKTDGKYFFEIFESVSGVSR